MSSRLEGKDLQARGHARHFAGRHRRRAQGTRGGRARTGRARGPLGTIIRLPLSLVAGTAAFIDRNLLLIIGLILVALGMAFFPDQRLAILIAAITALLGAADYREGDESLRRRRT